MFLLLFGFCLVVVCVDDADVVDGVVAAADGDDVPFGVAAAVAVAVVVFVACCCCHC